jgi:hypothetical protein
LPNYRPSTHKERRYAGAKAGDSDIAGTGGGKARQWVAVAHGRAALAIDRFDFDTIDVVLAQDE